MKRIAELDGEEQRELFEGLLRTDHSGRSGGAPVHRGVISLAMIGLITLIASGAGWGAATFVYKSNSSARMELEIEQARALLAEQARTIEQLEALLDRRTGEGA